MNILTFHSREIQIDKLQVSDYRATHLKEVLKVSTGQQVKVGQVDGPMGTAIVESIDSDGIILKLLELNLSSNSLDLSLILAMPRPQTLKKVLELIGCFSISKLFLINASKVEQSYFKSSILDRQQLEKHLTLGMQQGVKTKMPEVVIEKDFFAAIANLSKRMDLKKIVADQSSKIFMDKINFSNKRHVLLAVGPEGGWAEKELEFLINNGFESVCLSSSVLRVENAICSALSQYELTLHGVN